MPTLTIHRGTHQIGGCCTELALGASRVLIDFGANLPGADAPMGDAALVEKVLQGGPVSAVLFTHAHGDHYGLFRSLPPDTPMYIGPLARELLGILMPYIDRGAAVRGAPLVERMRTFRPGRFFSPAPGLRVLPLYTDHSAPDSCMFYIVMGGKSILFTGDFRDHGAVGQRGRLERVLQKYAPAPVDLLVTEGTMLSRVQRCENGLVPSEQALREAAERLFRRHMYNFVLVSSTNLDSVMSFYHAAPPGRHFVCDLYQARLMITAMGGMEARGRFPAYRPSRRHPVVRVLGTPDRRWAELREIGRTMGHPLYFRSVTDEELARDGFVLLARKNTHPEQYTSRFEELRDRFYPLDGQIIYSLWSGYLEPEHADPALLDFIGGRPIERLHTSGHACPEAIARLIEMVQPKTIVPMHTERAEKFAAHPALAPYAGRVRVLQDGEPLPL